MGALEDDDDHNDGVLSHHVVSVLYISVWSSGVAQSNSHLNTTPLSLLVTPWIVNVSFPFP